MYIAIAQCPHKKQYLHQKGLSAARLFAYRASALTSLGEQALGAHLSPLQKCDQTDHY